MIRDHLAQDANNFVFVTSSTSGYRYECASLTDIKKQWLLSDTPYMRYYASWENPDPEEGPTQIPRDRPRYQLFYECSETDSGRKIIVPPPNQRIFVKLTLTNQLVELPSWFWDGPVPEPRMFLLKPEGTVDQYFSSALWPSSFGHNAMVSAEHCNQPGPTPYFSLQPFYLGRERGREQEEKEEEEEDEEPRRPLRRLRRGPPPPPPPASASRFLAGGVVLALSRKQ